ncbi:MFS transporter [Rubripirellula sp.]|nr:MFS transporter [Rubripirellula sp.]MDB4338629.1 MFS transporter [Rubripirellula sp.]
MEPSDRLYDRNFIVAFASQTCFVCANTLMAHYARWIEFLGGDLRQVGLIMGGSATAGLILRPWMAQWINRWGSRNLWMAGYLLFILACMGNLLITEVGPALYVARSGLLMAAAIVFASGLTYISQIAPEHRRTEAIGILGIGGFIGMLLGPVLGDLFLSERTQENFATLFWVAAAANAIPTLGLTLLRPPKHHNASTSLRLGAFFQIVKKHWPGAILLVDFAFGVCMTGPFIFIASFIDHASLAIMDRSVIGLFFLSYAGLAIIVRVSSRRLPDRVGPAKVLIAGIAIMSAGMMGFAWVTAENTWVILIPAGLTGIGHSLMFHTMTSLTLASFPTAVRGTGSSLALMMLDLGTILGAPVLGWIGEIYGYAVLFATIGVICFMSGVIYMISERKNRRVD